MGGLKFAYAKRSTTDENAATVAAIYGDNTTADATSGGKLYLATRATGAAGTTTRMTVDETGYVGIGVTAPVEMLDVNGSMYLRGDTIYFSHDGATDMNNDYMSFNDGNDAIVAGNRGVVSFHADVARGDTWDNPTVSIASQSAYLTGRIAVGTTAPAARMHIVNDNGSDGQDDIRVDAYGGTTPGILFYKARGTVAAPTAVLDGDKIGALLTRAYNGSAWVRASEIVTVADNDWTATASTNNSYISFRPTAAGVSTQRMVLSSTGKLGINSATPNSYLSINGNGSTGWQLAVHGQGTTTSTYGIVHRDSANANVFWTRDDGASYFAQRIGVGVAPDLNYAIRAAGNVYIAGSGVNCTIGNGTGGTACSSDARLKENIVDIPDSLEKILRLRGVEFDWNKTSGREGQHAVGVIAQEVEKEFPTLVHREPTSGYLTVDYAGLVAPVIQAVKELYQELTGQARELASVKAELQVQKEKNEQLEKRLQRLEEKIAAQGL